MVRQVESEFLAEGNQLGMWWVPDDADVNEDGILHPLPLRREAGILSTADDGEWSLLLAPIPTADDDLGIASSRREIARREVMWGKAPGAAISLFDATQTSVSTGDAGSYRHEVWRGPWHVSSQVKWFKPADRVETIRIEIAAALRWADLPPGKGNKHSLHRHWDSEGRVFTRPERVVHCSTANGARVELCIGSSVFESGDEVIFELGTDLTVTDDIPIGEVRRKWVEPLHDLVGIFWLKNPGIVSVSVQTPDSLDGSEVGYSGRFAPVKQSQVLDAAHKFAPFTSVEGLESCGYSFDDLLNGYWDCRARGFGRAIQRLNESQDSHLDRSLDARMLSAVKSLESLEQALRGRSGSVNIAKATNNLVESTGAIGSDVSDIWSTRDKQSFKSSIAQIRNEYLAHEQGGESLKTRTDDQLTDHYWHHIALQWLLRRRLLGLMGIAESHADDLIADSLAYREVFGDMRRHYADT